jgi:hypothetical protein
VNQISSKVATHFSESKNLITVDSDVIQGIKLTLASTFFFSHLWFVASKENLPS